MKNTILIISISFSCLVLAACGARPSATYSVGSGVSVGVNKCVGVGIVSGCTGVNKHL